MCVQRKILIIEDDTALYELYAVQLKLKGYTVSNIVDGNLAFNGVKDQKPDLVLLDIMLPGKNGIEILQELKADPETKAIKVIMLTNYGTDENISKALELGAEDYMLKYNVVPSEITDKLAGFFGESSNSTVTLVE